MAGKSEIPGEIIRGLVDHVVTSKNAHKIKAGVTLAVMDAVDRKVSREHLAAILNDTFILSDLCARVQVTDLVHRLMHDKRFDEAAVEKMAKSLTCLGEEYREKVLKQLGLQAQCPEPEDTLN